MALKVTGLGPLIVQHLIAGFLHSVEHSQIVGIYRRSFRITTDISGVGKLVNMRETLN